MLVSSSEVYGTAERDPMDEEHPLNPRSPYAATKAGGDRLVYSYWCTYGTPAVVVRPFNNYGPYQHPEKVIPRFITAALQDRPLTVHGGGSASRDWLHVEDTSEAIAAIIAAPLERVAGQVLNVATGVDVDVQSIAERICDSLGKPRSLIAHVPDRPGQVDRHIGSTDKTAELRRLARAHRLRRGPRAHDPLVRRQPGLVGGARGRHQLARHSRAPPLIVLGAGAGQLGAYAAARRLGIETIACDRDRGAFCVREGLDRPLRARLGDGRRRSPRGWPSASARPASSRPAPTAPCASRRRWPTRSKLPHPLDPVAAARATDKREQRRAFAREGVPQPRFERGRHGTPGRRARRRQAGRGPGPARPRDRRAGRRRRGGGVRWRAGDSRDGQALCEEFVEGPEITVNAFLDGGRFVPLTVTDRERALAFGVATAHLYPSQHPVADVVAAAEAACRALGDHARARPTRRCCSRRTGRA